MGQVPGWVQGSLVVAVGCAFCMNFFVLAEASKAGGASVLPTVRINVMATSPDGWGKIVDGGSLLEPYFPGNTCRSSSHGLSNTSQSIPSLSNTFCKAAF